MREIINTQKILDLCIYSFFVLSSIIIMRYIIPDGLTQKFLLLGYKLIGIIFILLSIIFIISWFYNRNFNFKKKYIYLN